jgi:hypothetical protein
MIVGFISFVLLLLGFSSQHSGYLRHYLLREGLGIDYVFIIGQCSLAFQVSVNCDLLTSYPFLSFSSFQGISVRSARHQWVERSGGC